MIIKTGYYNWHEFGLEDSFYPDDMPEEWHLAFYANEIECAQLSLSGLSNLDDVEELFEDLSDQFNFIVHCDDINQWGLLKNLLDNGEINIRILLNSELFQKKWSKQLAQYSTPCIMEGEMQSVSFDSHFNGKQLLKDKLNIIYLDEWLNLKATRMLIEQWVDEEKGDEYYLLLNPKVYKSSVASEIRIMIEMMGY